MRTVVDPLPAAAARQPNRRDLLTLVAAFAASGGLGAQSSSAAKPSSNDAGPALAHSQIFPFDRLPVKPAFAGTGGATRSVIHGTLATGEFIEVHETTLPAGQTPHPPHRHTHSEFLLIRDGTLEVTSDGRQGIVQAGGVAFTASGVLHGLKNIGAEAAHYFVVAVGRQAPLP